MSRNTPAKHARDEGDDDKGGASKGDNGAAPQTLIGNAVRASRITRRDRKAIRELLDAADLIADLIAGRSDDPAIPPRSFVEQLRRPVKSRRQTIRVKVDGTTVPLLLNPQGKADPERESWLWNFIRNLVREGVA